MALVKRVYVDGETIITAQNLNDIQDEVIAHETNKVPITRTVNGKALSSNITLSASDVSAAPTSHASSATTYGKGTSSNYGHLKVTDSLTDTTTAATGGVALSAKAGKDLNTAINDTQDIIATRISSLVAPRALVVGDYVVYNGDLYRIISQIANGGAITIGTNAVATTVKNIKNYSGSGTDTNGNTASLTATVYDNTLVVLLCSVHTNVATPVGSDAFNGTITWSPALSIAQCSLAGFAAERPIIGAISGSTLVVRNTIREYPANNYITIQGLSTFIK